MVDLIEPLPPSKNQFRYALVVQDLFTKFVIIRLLRSANGPLILKALKDHIFTIYVSPQVLNTANATHLVNNVIDEALPKYGIEHSLYYSTLCRFR